MIKFEFVMELMWGVVLIDPFLYPFIFIFYLFFFPIDDFIQNLEYLSDITVVIRLLHL